MTEYLTHELKRRAQEARLDVDRTRARGDAVWSQYYDGKAEAFDQAAELYARELERATVLNYKNGATASVALWLDNEQPMSKAARVLADATFAAIEAGDLEAEAGASVLGDALRKLIERRPAYLLITEGNDHRGGEDMAHMAELLNDALASVDWVTLGRQWLEESAELAGVDS